jgi:cytidyltransferase-like protein
METIVIVSGGFDPVHKWHINYFQEAAQLGKVVCLLNSDSWLIGKKEKPFMNWEERAIVLSELRSISKVISFSDDDWTAVDWIRQVADMYKWHKILFAKGWDRNIDNIPEVDICNELWVEMVFDIGKLGKIQSSSWLIDNLKK